MTQQLNTPRRSADQQLRSALQQQPSRDLPVWKASLREPAATSNPWLAHLTLEAEYSGKCQIVRAPGAVQPVKDASWLW